MTDQRDWKVPLFPKSASLTLQGVDVSAPGVAGVLLHILFSPCCLRKELILDELPVGKGKLVYIPKA